MEHLLESDAWGKLQQDVTRDPEAIVCPDAYQLCKDVGFRLAPDATPDRGWLGLFCFFVSTLLKEHKGDAAAQMTLSLKAKVDQVLKQKSPEEPALRVLERLKKKEKHTREQGVFDASPLSEQMRLERMAVQTGTATNPSLKAAIDKRVEFDRAFTFLANLHPVIRTPVAKQFDAALRSGDLTTY